MYSVSDHTYGQSFFCWRAFINLLGKHMSVMCETLLCVDVEDTAVNKSDNVFALMGLAFLWGRERVNK